MSLLYFQSLDTNLQCVVSPSGCMIGLLALALEKSLLPSNNMRWLMLWPTKMNLPRMLWIQHHVQIHKLCNNYTQYLQVTKCAYCTFAINCAHTLKLLHMCICHLYSTLQSQFCLVHFLYIRIHVFSWGGKDFGRLQDRQGPSPQGACEKIFPQEGEQLPDRAIQQAQPSHQWELANVVSQLAFPVSHQTPSCGGSKSESHTDQSPHGPFPASVFEVLLCPR